MEVLAYLFILAIAAAIGVWNNPSMLEAVSAKCQARRDALRVAKVSYLWHLQKLRDER